MEQQATPALPMMGFRFANRLLELAADLKTLAHPLRYALLDA